MIIKLIIFLQKSSSQENGSGNKPLKEISRRIGELSIDGRRCTLAVRGGLFIYASMAVVVDDDL